MLADPKDAVPPYDAVLLFSPKRAEDAAFSEALKPSLAPSMSRLMREANLRASNGDSSADDAARWLGDGDCG